MPVKPNMQEIPLTENGKTPVAVYCRYSSHKQQELSIEGQERDIEAYCERNGYEIVARYYDRAKSATTTEGREAFNQMLRESANREWKYLIVYKLDRFARDKYDSVTNMHILRQQGQDVLSATENLGDGETRMWMEGILEISNALYSKVLSKNTRRGMREAALKCQVTTGKAPLGFKIVDKKYCIDENTVEYARYVFENYANGMSLTHIANYLNKHHMTTSAGTPLTVNALGRMIANTKYKGVYTATIDGEKIVIEGGVPAIVSEELWNRCNRRKDENRRTNGKHTPENRPKQHIYPLTGKVFCGECGDSVHGMSGKRKHFYYNCRNKRKKLGCTLKNVICSDLEGIVFKQIQAFCSENINTLTDYIHNLYIAKYGVKGDTATKQRIAATEGKINNLVNAIAETGNMSLIKKLKELEEEKQNLLEQLKDIEKLKAKIPTVPQIKRFIQDIIKAEETAVDAAQKQQLIDLFIYKVLIYNDGKVITYFNLGADGNPSKDEEKPDVEALFIMFDAQKSGGAKNKRVA